MHEKVGEEVVKNNIDILIAVGKEAENIVNNAIKLGMNEDNIYYYNSNKEAIDKIHKENDMVKDIEDNLFNKVTTKDIKEMK